MIDESWYVRPVEVPARAAAGGVVVRLEEGRVMVALAVERGLDAYVLPKGHVDPGESVEEAARREIEEEVGVSNLRLLELLGVLERLDYDKQEWKTTHYFLFTTEQVDAMPTDVEQHDQMRWFPSTICPSCSGPSREPFSKRAVTRL